MAFDRAALARHYPFEPRLLDLGAARLHFIDEGRGPPVALLHGSATWSFMYRELIKSLRESFRCLAPDFIGCGLSDKPGDRQYSYTLGRRIVDIEVFLNSASASEGVSLIMHEWGARVPAGQFVPMTSSGN